jgi:hypothetical protein
MKTYTVCMTELQMNLIHLAVENLLAVSATPDEQTLEELRALVVMSDTRKGNPVGPMTDCTNGWAL